MPIGLGHSGTDKATKFGAVSDYVVAGYVPTAADFVAEAYFDAGVADTFAGLLTFTRASSATYVDASGVLQTATTDTPRFTYDPSTGEKLGLMREPAATNHLTFSEDLSAGIWSTFQASISPNTAVAPDGLTTMDKLVEDTATGQHYLGRIFTRYVSGNIYTISFFAKAAERSQIRVSLPASFVGSGTAIRFDLGAGTATLLFGNTLSQEIIDFGGGVYRCSVTFTATATASGLVTQQLESAGSNSYTGDGTSGLYLWGMQDEDGVPSSYIATSGATATRAAETIQIPAANLSAPAAGGAWVVQMDGVITYADNNTDATVRPWLRIAAGNNFYADIDTTGSLAGSLQVSATSPSGTADTSSDVFTPGVDVPFSIAGLYSADRTQGAYDGNLLTAAAHSNGIPTFAGTDPFQIMPNGNAIIKKIRIFTDYVSDAVLAEMTT